MSRRLRFNLHRFLNLSAVLSTVGRLMGGGLVAMSLLAGVVWWRSRSAPDFEGDWIRHVTLDKAEPVAHSLCVEAEHGVLIVERVDVEILSSAYIDNKTDNIASNQQACRIEFESFEGWNYGTGHDNFGFGFREKSTTFFGRLGFQRSGNSSGTSEHCVDYGVAMSLTSFPLWVLVLPGILVLIVPAVPVVKRSRRRNSGLCLTCGYDLRATPDRCPECGRVVSPAAACDKVRGEIAGNTTR